MATASSTRFVTILRIATATCVLALLAALVWAFQRYAVNVPAWDQWNVIYLFEEYFKGSLDFQDFYKPHNEHRLLFPKMLMLGLGLLTNYNVLYEMGVSIFLGCCILALLTWHTASRQKLLHLGRRRYLLYAGLAVLLLSLRQHENWFWGFQVQWYMNVLGVCAAFVLLSRACEEHARGFARFVGAMACAVLATFSLAAGLLAWPLGLAGILVSPCPPARRIACAGVWSITAGAVCFFYFHGLETMAGGSLLQSLQQPLAVAHYVLVYLASPFTLWGRSGLPELLLGGAVVTLLLAETLRVLRLPGNARSAGLVFVLLGWYALGTACITAGGRLELGLMRAASSRYVTIALLAWLPALQLLLAAPGWQQRGRRVLQPLGLTLAACLLALGLLRAWQSLPYMNFAWRQYSIGQWSLLHNPSDEGLQTIAWSPEHLRQYAIPLLQRHGLSVYSDTP